ncbi:MULTISPECIES: hypothetical protein [Salinibaculum]|uniref:hypothetical protein n=1 Tax=Salinibaculum TaxID=2732368 RepID=UPI0030CF87CB
MKRRKFVVGLGSLAAGAGTAMGTGAFSGQSSKRKFYIASKGDADAFTKLKKVTSWPHSAEYTYYDGGHLVVDIPRLNSDSKWYFKKLFKLGANLTKNDGKHKYWIKNKYSQYCKDNGGTHYDGKQRVRWFCTSIYNGNDNKKRDCDDDYIHIPKPSGGKKKIGVEWLSGGDYLKLSPGDYCAVGVCINTRGLNVDDWKDKEPILKKAYVQAKAADHE